MNGIRIKVATVMISMAPPKFWNHFPKARPRREAATTKVINDTQTKVVIHLFSCIQFARGPIA